MWSALDFDVSPSKRGALATALALCFPACNGAAPSDGPSASQPALGGSSASNGGSDDKAGASSLGGSNSGGASGGAAGSASASAGASNGGNAGGGGMSAAGGLNAAGAAVTAGSGGQPAGPDTPDATAGWVLSYFGPEQSVAADSLHLAYSSDGLHWTRLGSGPAYQLTNLGTNHIRDPFILRKKEGGFVFIATDWTLSNNDSNYWNNPSSKILLADSQDLISFVNARTLALTSLKGAGGKAMHAWAPEAYYDAAADQYAIIWSGNDSADRNRIYLSYTKDFQSTIGAEPTVLFDPGYSVIDGTVTTWNGASYLFFKDETDGNGGSATGSGKDIQVARAASESLVPGGFTRTDAAYIPRGNNQSKRQATEGPFVIKDPKRELWYLYADFYTQGGIFGCWSTTDLNAKPSSWTRLADADYSLPAGVRHAHALRVTQAELDALKAHYE